MQTLFLDHVSSSCSWLKILQWIWLVSTTICMHSKIPLNRARAFVISYNFIRMQHSKSFTVKKWHNWCILYISNIRRCVGEFNVIVKYSLLALIILFMLSVSSTLLVLRFQLVEYRLNDVACRYFDKIQELFFLFLPVSQRWTKIWNYLKHVLHRVWCCGFSALYFYFANSVNKQLTILNCFT